jgi:hypothetical protein
MGRIIGWTAVAIVGLVAVLAMPDIARYLRMRRM